MANPTKGTPQPEPKRITPNPLLAILAAANVPVAERYTITVTKLGEVESVAPIATKPDVVVDCKEKHRRCVATYRIKRIGEEHERMVCVECVGSGNQNLIMVKL